MECIQQLDTSGARAVETFVEGGVRYLVVPQLATDIPGQPAQMTLGDSNTQALLFRWEEGRFVAHGGLDVPGGEDAEFFSIGPRHFLAMASLRTGGGPYAMEADSTIFEWKDGQARPFQHVRAHAAKQWKHFRMGGRDFLALAQGASTAAVDSFRSCIFEWDGTRFVAFQDIPSAWGYNWASFEVDGLQLLAYADHAMASRLLRWNGAQFEPFQAFGDKGGRAFCFFAHAGQSWLAYADLFGDTTMHRWDGSRFEPTQALSGPGGREFRWIPGWEGGRLVQVNFLLGTREAPVTGLQSLVHRFDGSRWVVAQRFPTSGGTDAVAFEEGGVQYLVVSESLSPEVRFRTPSKVYRIGDARGRA